MLEIYDADVQFHSVKYLTVRWKIKPTTEDISLYTFRVLRSRSAEGEYNKIIDLKEQFVYHDADLEMSSKYRQFFYKIMVYEDLDPTNFMMSDVAYLPQKPEKIAAEIIRRNDLLLRTRIGVPCLIYNIKTWGQYCTNCFDHVKKRKRISNCPICYNTGFVNGYLGPIGAFVNFNPSQKMIRQAGFEMQPDNIAAWMGNYPPMNPKDIILESGVRRWRVVQQSETEMKRVPIHQMLQLIKINHSDIEYELKYKELTED